MVQQWQLFALASAFFAGLVAILAKVGVAHIPSNTATLIRTLVITFFLGLLILIRGEWVNPLSMNKKELIFLVLSGIATGVSWICYFRALQMGPASLVAAVDKVSLIFAVLLASFCLGEHLNWQQWAGVALMTGGALLVVLK